MSKKYINADALLDKIERMWDTHQLTNTKHKTFVDLLNAEPAADVRENVRGEWEIMEDADGCTYYRCSACHRYRFHNGAMLKKYRFCPICGAENRPKKQRARI